MQTASEASQTQNRSKGSLRRRRLVMLVLACFLSWAVVTLWNQFTKLDERRDKVLALQQKQEEAEQYKQSLQREIERLNDREYQEQIIRKELHYVKNGKETLFYAPAPSNK